MDVLTESEIKAWRDQGPDIRTGTACKCGTHCSSGWDQGGREWFEGHVLENHVDEKKKLAQLARSTMILPASQDSYSVLEVQGLLGAQREAIARAILGLGPESDETVN